jgi:hypothetical protein
MRSFVLTVMLAFLFTACAGNKVPISKFQRIDKKVGNFTKHFEESLFKVTDKELYSAEVLLFDRNLKVGRNDFDIVIHDRNDNDVEDAYIEIIARTPKNQFEAKPNIMGSLPGLYSIYKLNLPRAGNWELFIKISHNKLEDSVVFDFSNVQ